MRALACLVLTGLLAAGCTAERPEQQTARELVEVHVAELDGYDGHVRCTRNPRPWFISRDATVFVCAARRDDGDCDWFRVTIGEAAPEVALEQKRGGCVLPL